MNCHWILTLFGLTLFTALLSRAGDGLAATGLARLLVAVFCTLACISLALHEARRNLA